MAYLASCPLSEASASGRDCASIWSFKGSHTSFCKQHAGAGLQCMAGKRLPVPTVNVRGTSTTNSAAKVTGPHLSVWAPIM